MVRCSGENILPPCKCLGIGSGWISDHEISRLGHDDDDDDEFSDHEEASGMSKDRLEVRRKRRALNKGTKETDEDIYEDEEEEKTGKKDKEEGDETPPVSFAQAGHVSLAGMQ